MKTLSGILFTCCLLSLTPFRAEAQNTIAVDLQKARLTWTWAQGTGGPVTAFHMKCGATTGSYNILVSIPDPTAQGIALSSVMTAVGKYFCAVSAANAFGESINSNEVSFDVGVGPVAPASLTIQAQ